MNTQDLSFCKFRIPQEGGRVIWEITNECNYSCSYCIFASTGRKPDNELSTEKIINTLIELKQHNFTHIKFTGGEPFLRADMIYILQQTKKLGFECDISTNASQITEEIALELEKLNLEMIHVSLDGHNQHTHESVRGKKSFEPTLRGLKILANKNINIRIGCVIHEFNENNLNEMVLFAEDLKARELVFSLMEPVGRMREDKRFLALKTPQLLAHEVDNLKTISKIKINHNLSSNIVSNTPKKQEKNSVCPGGTQFLFVNSTGDISPCTWITEKAAQFILGNIQITSIKEILNSEKFSIFRNKVQQLIGKCPAEKETLPNINTVKFTRQSKVYAFSTENLEYLSKIDMKNKSVLTVGASLDQNIVCNMLGATLVKNFDINENAYFYSQLKKAALICLKYNDFLNFFMRGEQAFNRHTYNKIQPYLNRECDLFFQTLYNTYKKGKTLREEHLFNNLFDVKENKIFNSFYLRTAENYLLAQQKMQADLFWETTDIIEMVPKEKFDLILLSNVADYSHKMFLDKNHALKFKTKVVDKFYEQLNPGGLIMFAYIFDYHNKNNSSKRNIINDMPYRRKIYNSQNNYFEVEIPSAINGLVSDCACFMERSK